MLSAKTQALFFSQTAWEAVESQMAGPQDWPVGVLIHEQRPAMQAAWLVYVQLRWPQETVAGSHSHCGSSEQVTAEA